MSESIKRIDYYALLFSTLGLFVSFVIASELINPGAAFPFTDYYLNSGMRAILIAKSATLLTIFAIFVWFAVNKRLSRAMFRLLLVGIMVACALTFFELWWGSTFYYGEVRDKQGIHFPYGSLIWLVYIIWRTRLPLGVDNWIWRLIGTVISIVILWFVWGSVQEPWNLGQS